MAIASSLATFHRHIRVQQASLASLGFTPNLNCMGKVNCTWLRLLHFKPWPIPASVLAFPAIRPILPALIELNILLYCPPTHALPIYILLNIGSFPRSLGTRLYSEYYTPLVQKQAQNRDGYRICERGGGGGGQDYYTLPEAVHRGA